MSDFDKGWEPNFPPVMHFIDIENTHEKPFKILEAHPDYEAAKKQEDRSAALRLVDDFLQTQKNQSQLSILQQKYSKAFIVPVRAIEACGKNRIPEVLAEYIGHITGFEINTDIIQSNQVHRTGSDEWHRFAFRPTYDGFVISSQNYIIVDDVFSLGGTFNEMRRFIENNNGKVVHTIAMATGRSGSEIALNPKTYKSLVDIFGENNLKSFLKEINLYDGNCKALTEPEARALRRASSLDKARDRIFAARCQGGSSVGSASTQKHETTQIESPDQNQSRGRRR